MRIQSTLLGCVVAVSLVGCSSELVMDVEESPSTLSFIDDIRRDFIDPYIQLASDGVLVVTGKRLLQTKRDAVLDDLSFTCVKETFPELPSDADILYQYALYHDFKNRQLKQKGGLDPYLPYYRIAAASGHWRANTTLQEILMNSDYINIPFPDRRKEGVQLNEALMPILPATAHYWWGKYITYGYYEPEHEPKDAFSYFQKAANLGHGKAQSKFAGYLIKVKDKGTHDKRFQVALDLDKCAGLQTFPDRKGATMASVALEGKENYHEALKFEHRALMAGEGTSKLKSIFDHMIQNPYIKWELIEDKERARRYEQIVDFIWDNQYLNPELNVYDLDDIVPLPPTPLPEWDGKIAIQRFIEGAPPAKPDDALVRRLAEKAGLNHLTGLPK